MTKGRRCCRKLLIVGTLLGGLYLARSAILPMAARWLDVGEKPQAADYVMVLAGEENTRPFVAAAILKTGLAKKVLLTHVKRSDDVVQGLSPPIHQINRHILVRRGVAQEDIVILGRQIGHTFGEAEALARFLETSPEARVTVVTSNYHTRRARWVFTRVLEERSHQVSFVSAPAYHFREENWGQIDRGVRTVVGEYLKFAFYGVRYGRLVHCAVVASIAAVLVAFVYRHRRKLCRVLWNRRSRDCDGGSH